MKDIRPDPTRSLEAQSDRVLERINLCMEARGEQNQDGTLEASAMAGIAHVVRTRAHERGRTVGEVILQPYQFSWTRPQDPNYKLALKIHELDPISWERADTVCDLMDLGLLLDPTHGSNHYYNPSIAQPSWGRGHPSWIEKQVLGNHAFGRSA